MTKLAEFLLARIAEDEAAAWGTGNSGYTLSIVDGVTGTTVGGARLRAECEVKRRIVAAARDYSPELEHGDNGEWAFDLTLRALALPYSDHPDFREEWRI
jgi:hypothetical protein